MNPANVTKRKSLLNRFGLQKFEAAMKAVNLNNPDSPYTASVSQWQQKELHPKNQNDVLQMLKYT